MNNLRFEVKDRVATVVVDRPDVLNAINLETMSELESVLGELEKNEEVLALVVAGAGQRSFISGGDLKEFRNLTTVHDGWQMGHRMGQILARLENLDIPVIGAINGNAFGGGCEVSVACDIRVCGDRSSLGFRQVKFAITPGWGGGQRLLRIVGRSKALILLTTGRIVSAHDALGMGLVDMVVPHEQVMASALELAHEIASNAPLAVKSAKRAINQGRDMPMLQSTNYELELFSITWGSQDHMEGMRAYEEKREAKFEGR